MKILINNKISEIISFTITKGIGKGYNTCDLVLLEDIGAIGDVFTLYIGSDTYKFIIFDKMYSDDIEFTIMGKGLPALLDNELYAQSFNSIAKNSIMLINENKLNIDVVINIPTIDFKEQTYIKDGTRLNKILDMVKVVGGEVFENNSKLYLELLKTIPPNSTGIKIDDYVFNYNYHDVLFVNNKVKNVYINPNDEDVYSETNIIMRVKKNYAKILFNPSLSSNIPYTLSDNLLTHKQETLLTQIETISISNKSYVIVTGGVDSVEYILLNGEILSDFTLHNYTNIIEFLNNISGQLEIKYKTKGLFLSGLSSGYYNIIYNCKILEDYLTISNSYLPLSCINTVIDNLTYTNGGSFYLSTNQDITFIFYETKGGVSTSHSDTSTTSAQTFIINSIKLLNGKTLTIKHRYAVKTNSDNSFMSHITFSTTSIPNSFQTKIMYDDILDAYVINLPSEDMGVTGVYYNNSTIPYDTKTNSLLYFDAQFDDKEVEITYNRTVIKIDIPPIISNPNILGLEVLSCNSISDYPLIKLNDPIDPIDPIDPNDPNDEVFCSLPANIPINVAEQFGYSINAVIGKAIVSNKLGTFVVDGRGYITVTITEQDEYTLDCSSIVERAELYIDSTGVKYA